MRRQIVALSVLALLVLSSCGGGSGSGRSASSGNGGSGSECKGDGQERHVCVWYDVSGAYSYSGFHYTSIGKFACQDNWGNGYQKQGQFVFAVEDFLPGDSGRIRLELDEGVYISGMDLEPHTAPNHWAPWVAVFNSQDEEVHRYTMSASGSGEITIRDDGGGEFDGSGLVDSAGESVSIKGRWTCEDYGASDGSPTWGS